ncbi:MAG: DUF1579 family protein [Phycisphaerales bacterium]|nr:DUF1579 family protein [Phycisphaerales bacterium]
MKTPLMVLAGLVISAAGFLAVSLRVEAQDSRPAGAAPATRPAAQASTRPGEAHARLARRVGKYETSIVYKPKAPTGDITTSGEAELRMSLDGRFLIDENSGVLLGRNFTGLRMTGYNNATGKYEAAWADTNSTGLVRLLGESEDGGKTVVYAAKLETESGTFEFTATDQQVDDNSFVITISSATSTLSITYKRRS